MQIRDAHEEDADAIASLASGDVDTTHLLQERTVRVAETGGKRDEEDADRDVVGFVAYDARPDAVHVTRVGGSEDAVAELLESPLAFAASEDLPVEAVVPAGGDAAAALETKGFSDVGAGPRFQGRETRRYRYEV